MVGITTAAEKYQSPRQEDDGEEFGYKAPPDPMGAWSEAEWEEWRAARLRKLTAEGDMALMNGYIPTVPVDTEALAELDHLAQTTMGNVPMSVPDPRIAEAAEEAAEEAAAEAEAEAQLQEMDGPDTQADAGASADEAPEKPRWDDREFVMEQVAADGEALQHASARLRGDKDLVLAAVAQSPKALQHASALLWTDVDVAIAASDDKTLRAAAESGHVSLEEVIDAGLLRLEAIEAALEQQQFGWMPR